MYNLNSIEGFDRLLQLIREQNESKQKESESQNTTTNYDEEIQKILNHLKLTMKHWKTATGMYSISHTTNGVWVLHTKTIKRLACCGL